MPFFAFSQRFHKCKPSFFTSSSTSEAVNRLLGRAKRFHDYLKVNAFVCKPYCTYFLHTVKSGNPSIQNAL